MSKRNGREAKAARRAVRANPSHGSDVEIPLHGAVPGCPLVPAEPVPLAEFVMPPGAVRVPAGDLPAGVMAAVRWWCRDGCGQDHVVVWGQDG